MATSTSVKIHPGRRKADSMTTKNGKPRLGPLNLKQLTELFNKTSTKKIKAKIQRHIQRRTKLIND